ncbi:hypothetical protein EJ110_NYTH16007, partial [Nymphaea thermarum]
NGHVLGACKDSLKKLTLDYLDRIPCSLSYSYQTVGTPGSVMDVDFGALDRHFHIIRNYLACNGKASVLGFNSYRW